MSLIFFLVRSLSLSLAHVRNDFSITFIRPLNFCMILVNLFAYLHTQYFDDNAWKNMGHISSGLANSHHWCCYWCCCCRRLRMSHFETKWEGEKWNLQLNTIWYHDFEVSRLTMSTFCIIFFFFAGTHPTTIWNHFHFRRCEKSRLNGHIAFSK